MTKEELKQEAEELYEDWYAHKLGAISIIDVICKMAEPREKRIAELEKENAELKDDNKVMADDYSKIEQKFYDNLTKAKEIIRAYMLYCKGETQKYKETEKKAEQFLKEIEQ